VAGDPTVAGHDPRSGRERLHYLANSVEEKRIHEH